MQKQKFNINNWTRLEDDACARKMLNQNNQTMSNYNFPGYLSDVSSRNEYFDSFNQPGVFQTGNFSGYSQSVNAGSQIRNGSTGNIITHDKSKKQFDTANYLTPPDKASNRTMALNPDAMSKLYSGELSKDKSSLRGKTIDRFVPLIPEVESQIQNPKNLVPTYWVRGGMDSRVVIRNIDYLKSCGLKR